ncbi:MAG: thioredoxin domain-containing protein [Acidobacteriota bacterium]|nr:thioredoxin domain-containing protein [Acidobacteriota bacterium]
MKSVFLRACGLAGLCLLVACLLGAQDWKNAESLPGVDFGGLSPAQKTTVLNILRERGCSCGCSMKLAECRVVDPSCSYSTSLAAVIVSSIKAGKSEAEAQAAADASKWAHVQQPSLLEDAIQIPVSGAPQVGPQNAPVTLVEFSDFQCPYCAAAVPQIHAIMRAYPSQVKLIYKQFPLDFHPQADLAAAAAVAAQKQGKFWVMHDALYNSQSDLSRKHILELAEKGGLDMKRFEQDIDSTEVRERVVKDVKDGEQAGVQGTPTLFVNGQRYNGQISLAMMKPIVDAELKGKAQSQN